MGSIYSRDMVIVFFCPLNVLTAMLEFANKEASVYPICHANQLSCNLRPCLFKMSSLNNSNLLDMREIITISIVLSNGWKNVFCKVTAA